MVISKTVNQVSTWCFRHKKNKLIHVMVTDVYTYTSSDGKTTVFEKVSRVVKHEEFKNNKGTTCRSVSLADWDKEKKNYLIMVFDVFDIEKLIMNGSFV